MNVINKHPVLLHASDIEDICRPLSKLNISYFAHVNIDKAGQFSAVSNHPEFHKHYLQQGYHHADIHLANSVLTAKYIIWDSLVCSGESEQMNQDAEALNIRHTFTIIDKNATGDNFYHFSTHIKEHSFNQTYLSNIDLLEMFVSYFHACMNHSKKLLKAYEFKYSLDKSDAECNINTGSFSLCLGDTRAEFMRELSMPRAGSKTEAKRLQKNNALLIHKDTNQAVALYRQQLKCMVLLMEGHTAREIADKINLSCRTVNHYLENLRNKLGCRTSKELISAYYGQIMRFSL